MRWFGRLAEVGRAIVTLPYRRIEFIRIGRWRRVRYRRREDIE
jgi:hypothetical protein